MNATSQIPLWITISQWGLLLVLGLLVIIAYRQLSYFINLRDVLNNAGTEKEGLPLGSQAPSFSYKSIKDLGYPTQHFSARGNWSLLLITDPECASCRNALTTLTKLEPQLRSRLRMLAITTSDPTFIEAISDFRNSPIEIGHVEREVVHKSYLINTTPFFYVIDPEGVIRAKRVTDDENGIKKALREAERMNESQFVVVQPGK